MQNSLIGFDNKPITINRKGRLTPVDAELISADEGHELHISTNLCIFDEGINDQELFKKAVMDGVKEWDGEYKVFKDQKIKVITDITVNERIFDSVKVFALSDDMLKWMTFAGRLIPLKKGKDRLENFIRNRRSFAVPGMKKWSVHSKKIIYILDSDGTFSDYDEIKKLTKHEFGHVLGLGDLYRSLPDGLMGVKHGKYKDLDKYRRDIFKNYHQYDIVMCDNGRVTDNDIEMVILAFRDNEMQHYQENYSNRKKEKISDALGRGN